MTKKIPKEIRSRIHCLHNEGKSVKEVLSLLKQDNVLISDKTIYRIIKGNKEDKENNASFASFNDSFTELEKINKSNDQGMIGFNDSFTDREVVVFDAREDDKDREIIMREEEEEKHEERKTNCN